MWWIDLLLLVASHRGSQGEFWSVTIQRIVAGLGLSRSWVECSACSKVSFSRSCQPISQVGSMFVQSWPDYSSLFPFVLVEGQVIGVRWAPVGSYSFMTSLSPGVTPKALSWEGIGLSGRDVVVIQEIEPKVRFLILQSLYTYMRQL